MLVPGSGAHLGENVDGAVALNLRIDALAAPQQATVQDAPERERHASRGVSCEGECRVSEGDVLIFFFDADFDLAKEGAQSTVNGTTRERAVPLGVGRRCDEGLAARRGVSC